MALAFQYSDKTISEFVSHFKEDRLNLEPAFQRQSVWSGTDRKKLIESILEGYPMPSVFLYINKNERGEERYDVIDGKQRLESILMFQGIGRFRGQRFSIRTRLGAEERTSIWDWRGIQKRGHALRITSYKIQTVEVSGEFSEINELFVRINSTGKRLTSAEKRHARCYTSEFLRIAEKLARSHQSYFLQHRVLSAGQISRMKDVELICELLASIHRGGPINKKEELDKIIGGKTLDGRSSDRCIAEFRSTLNLARRLFPDLATTRFGNAVDFYSLFLLLWSLDKQGCVLTDRKRNEQAQKLLIWLSSGVEQVRQQLRKAEGAHPEQALFRDYLLTIKGDTDSEATRKRRADILSELLGGLFEKKDVQRTFTLPQRQLIWNSDESKKCRKCGKPLTWNNFTIDHIKPHALGGPTAVSNAALMCRPCNSRKGARPR
jgi:hypothetical protein